MDAASTTGPPEEAGTALRQAESQRRSAPAELVETRGGVVRHPADARRRLASRVCHSRPLHFALLGALLFAANRWRTAEPPATAVPLVVASAADVDDELLLREALARQFDRRDPVVHERLIGLARYLGLAAPDDPAALEREARALGLQRSDPTVRRHLIEMMRLAAAEPGPRDVPDEAALRAYYTAHAERFAVPARTTLTHVYLSRDRHGTALAPDAQAMLDDLRARTLAPEAAPALGDPFVRGSRIRNASTAELARSFGPAFSASVGALPERAWSGPVTSPYGMHLVFVEARTPAQAAPFAAVRNRVVHELLRARGDQRLRETLDALRARYDVRIVPAAATRGAAAAATAADSD